MMKNNYMGCIALPIIYKKIWKKKNIALHHFYEGAALDFQFI